MNDGEWKSIKNYENWTLSGDKTLSCANFVVIKSYVVIKTLSSDKKLKKWKGAITCEVSIVAMSLNWIVCVW